MSKGVGCPQKEGVCTGAGERRENTIAVDFSGVFFPFCILLFYYF